MIAHNDKIKEGRFLPQRWMKTLALLTICAGLGACTYEGQREAMVPTEVPIAKRSSKSVTVRASGGMEKNFWSGGKVSNAELAGAVELSIKKYRVFSSVVGTGKGDYMLDVRLVQIDAPTLAGSVTVTAEVEWRLRRRSDNQLVWSKKISTPYTAKFGEALYGAKRFNLASEGAVRANIASGLGQISQLSL